MSRLPRCRIERTEAEYRASLAEHVLEIELGLPRRQRVALREAAAKAVDDVLATSTRSTARIMFADDMAKIVAAVKEAAARIMFADDMAKIVAAVKEAAA
jgi:hypothetical protein